MWGGRLDDDEVVGYTKVSNKGIAFSAQRIVQGNLALFVLADMQVEWKQGKGEWRLGEGRMDIK